VLRRVLDLRPVPLTSVELARALGAKELALDADRAAVDAAVATLTAAGLVDRADGFVTASRTAVYLAELRRAAF
jgi:hypothetical protein